MAGSSAERSNAGKRLYAFLSRNARPATDSYRILAEPMFEISIPAEL